MTKVVRKLQTAYEIGVGEDSFTSTDDHVYRAMYSYLRKDLGLAEPVAQERATSEVTGKLVQGFCDECEELNLTFGGKLVLDLGAGLGGLSAEVARRGATVVSIEPGAAWRSVAAERLAKAGNGVVLGGVGEALPVASNSIDLIVSLQVLEHVQSPQRVIEEAYRVLKPGGHFFFAYENYLSFYEPHYRVRWLPLLPKPLGAAYLRRLGRDPQFLLEAVTYTTFPAVRRHLFATGFKCTRIDNFRSGLRSPAKTSAKWKLMKAISSVHEGLAVQLMAGKDYLQRTCKTAIHELVRKPS